MLKHVSRTPIDLVTRIKHPQDVGSLVVARIFAFEKVFLRHSIGKSVDSRAASVCE